MICINKLLPDAEARMLSAPSSYAYCSRDTHLSQDQDVDIRDLLSELNLVGSICTSKSQNSDKVVLVVV